MIVNIDQNLLFYDCKRMTSTRRSELNSAISKNLFRFLHVLGVTGAAVSVLVPTPTEQFIVSRESQVVFRPQAQLLHVFQSSQLFGFVGRFPCGSQLSVAVPPPVEYFAVFGQRSRVGPAGVDLLERRV